jgi:hypothetical protein
MQNSAGESNKTTSPENESKPVSKKERKPMDPVTLAAAVTSLLAPFIKKVGEKAMDKLAEQLPGSVGKIWDAISSKSSNVTEAASDLAKNPDDADNEVFFKKQLQKVLEKDQDLASLLTDLTEKAKSESSISIVGDGVVANNNSIAIKDISVGGDLSGNLVIGNNNQVANK